jgi:predicted esterase
LNALQFSALKLYGDPPPKQSLSEICSDDSEVDAVKACQTLAQATKFSQLIENRTENLGRYCSPWIALKRAKKDYADRQAQQNTLIQELESESIAPEDKEKEQKRLKILSKGITATYDRIQNFQNQIETLTKELNNFLNTSDPWKAFQEVYSKFNLKNIDSIKLEEVTVATDDENITCYVYAPKSDRATPPYPCIFWLHGGSVGIKDNCRYSDPNQLDISFDDFLGTPYNFTYGLQPLARYLVQNDIAFATITIRGKNGNGNIREQIKDQIEEIKKLDYIDGTRMALIGHSNGGHIMTQMIANEYAFLNENFKLGVGLASPYINESWGSSSIGQLPMYFDSFNHFAFQHAAPNDVPKNIDCSMPIKEFQGKEAKYVYKYAHPLSITSGMSRKKLKKIFDQLKIPVFLFVGLKDYNTPPTTQNGTVAWLLKEIGFDNWRTFAYAGAAHSPHRIQNIKTNENIPPEQSQAFESMLSDMLSIGKGKPNEGTQNLKIFNQDKKVKEYSPELIFLQFENGEKRKVKFKDTDCGKEILGE